MTEASISVAPPVTSNEVEQPSNLSPKTTQTKQTKKEKTKKNKKPYQKRRGTKEPNQATQPSTTAPVSATSNGKTTPPIPDPRLQDKTQNSQNQNQQQRLTIKATKRGTGRNTESFDPASTWVRPSLRICVGSPQIKQFNKPLRHDDVVIVPELFGAEDNWDLYYQLLDEMKDRKDWTSWHEGAHLIVKYPDSSPTFQKVVKTLCEYFQIRPQSLGVRFNWYKDSTDWKPFHHDSAAFNPQRAKTQNITVGASFGACRELAFLLATDKDSENSQQQDTRIYFPQPNNGVFSFGRDVNIRWKHGINAVQDKPNEKNDQGRISIIVWGLAQNVIEEDNSPPLLGSDGQGPHAATATHSRNKKTWTNGNEMKNNGNNNNNKKKKNHQRRRTNSSNKKNQVNHIAGDASTTMNNGSKETVDLKNNINNTTPLSLS